MFHLEEIFTRTDILVKRCYCLKLTKLKCTRARLDSLIKYLWIIDQNLLLFIFRHMYTQIFDILVFAAIYGKVWFEFNVMHASSKLRAIWLNTRVFLKSAKSVRPFFTILSACNFIYCILHQKLHNLVKNCN